MPRFLRAQSWLGYLRAGGLDGYIALKPQHVFALTGFTMPLHANTNPNVPVTVVASESACVLVVPRIQLAYLAQQDVAANAIVTFGDFDLINAGKGTSRESQCLAELLESEYRAPDWAAAVALAKGIVGTSGTFGYDDHVCSEERRATLQRLLGGKLVAGSSSFEHLKRHKTPEAHERIGRATRVAEVALVECLRHAEVGVTQGQLHREYRAAVGNLGGVAGHVGIGVGGGSPFPINLPTETRIARGDIIRLDVGALIDGFFADTARVVVVGEDPSPATLGIYEALLEAHMVTIELLRVGEPVGSLYEAALRAVRKHLAGYYRPHFGHGIGTDRYEPPLVTVGEDLTIEEGEVLNIEVPFYDLVNGGFNIEDTFAIQGAGVRRLTSLPRALTAVEMFVAACDEVLAAPGHKVIPEEVASEEQDYR